MNKVTTAERLKEYMNQNGLKQKDILSKALPYCKKYNIRLGKNDISQYVSGKVEPGQKKLSILAKALDVNPVWLMGYDIPSKSHIEEDKSYILKEKIEKLSPDQKDAIIKIIDNMKND